MTPARLPSAPGRRIQQYVTVTAREPRNVGSERRTVAELLGRWGIAENPLESVLLVVSELLTNAVLHGRSESVGLSLVHDGAQGRVRIEVDDRTPGPRPRPRLPDADDEGGRGLLLVEAIGEQWGVSKDGSVTWCVVDTDAGPHRENRPA